MLTINRCGILLPSTLLLFAWFGNGVLPHYTSSPTSASAPFSQVAPGSESHSGYPVFKWVNGNDRIRMIPADSGFCFLSAVGGSFAGGGESVRVYVDDGWWYLEGKCLQPLVWAEATCLEFDGLPVNQTQSTDDGTESQEGAPPALTVSVIGSRHAIRTLDNGMRAFGNRLYFFQQVPQRFRGWQFTQLNGGVGEELSVRGRTGQTVYIATAPGQPGVNLEGWTLVPHSAFVYSDSCNTRMSVYSRRLQSTQSLQIPQGSWAGCAVLAREVTQTET